MGTNYYAVMEENVCSHCQRGEAEKWHIGKSSGGWCFALHVGSNSEPHIPTSLDAWREIWQKALRLEDEYGDSVTLEQMERIITDRMTSERPLTQEWLQSNHAELGPNNLVRHKVDGRYCVGHGESTYDLCPGHFS